MDFIIGALGFIIVAVVIIGVSLIPFFIANKRNHAYKWIILALCFFAPTGFAWIAALIWAVWPSEKSIIDPIVGNVTGTGTRNTGSTTREVKQESRTKADKLGELAKLAELKNAGAITEEEFAGMKAEILA